MAEYVITTAVGTGENGFAGHAEPRLAGGVAVEQLQPELCLQIGDGVADDRSRPPEPLGGRGETADLDDSEKDLELVKRGSGI